VTTDRLTVVANSGPRSCAKLALQVLTFERLLRELANVDEETALRPMTLYSLSDNDAQRVLLSDTDRHQQSSKGMRIWSKYLPGADFNVAAIVDTDANDQPLQSVLLLYAQSLLYTGPARGFPPWYSIGVANIVNGVVIRNDGSALLNRDGPFEPEVEKRVRTQYALDTLLATSVATLNTSGDVRAFTRRARDWAQYGLLTTPERRKQFRELALLMRQGTPAAEAVSSAFGVPLPELSKQFDDGTWKRQADYRIRPPATLPSLPPAERLDAAQATQLLQVIADRVAQSAR
jgi:hypothetical protein